jgi:PKD repeat protein
LNFGPSFQVRWVYDDGSLWAWYWALDNVHIYSPLIDDMAVVGVLSPVLDGRALTSSALGNEVVGVTVRNVGLDTIYALPMYFQVDGNTPSGPEMVNVLLPPNGSTNFTFTATANLAAVRTHNLAVWCALASDFNHSNDTIRFSRTQWDNPQLLFPHCQSFEAAPDTSVQTEMIGLRGVPEMDFSTSQPNMGRMRSFAGLGFPRTGIRALTLDRNPTGSPDAINYVTFTYNLSGLSAPTDQVLMDLAMIEHGDEVQLHDSIWIRGCDTCAWKRIIGWNTLSGGVNGAYFLINNFDLSAALVSVGQNFSSSFQIRVGQEDNFNAFGLTGSDGMSFDDLCLRRVLEQDALPKSLLHPINGSCGDSSSSVVAVFQNGGRDTLYNIPVAVEITGPMSYSFVDTLAGPIYPNQPDTLVFGMINTHGGGNYQFSLLSHLLSDEYLANDTLVVPLQLLGLPAPPTVPDDTVCTGDSITLSVLNPGSGFEWTWYDAPLGGNLLGQGASLGIGPVLGTTLVYVESRHSRKGRVGPSSNAIGNGTANGAFASGLRFDAYREFVLDSLRVYPADTGWVHVQLADSSGLLLLVDSVYVEPAQAFAMTTLALNMPIPTGIAHRLSATGTSTGTLWRNSTGANYPYTHADVVAITGTLNNLPGYYYFFYDWHISYPDCPGPRGVVRIDTASIPAQAGFNASTQFLQVNLQNQSQFGNQWAWDFGDGNTSTAAHPQHTYAVGGTYNVCLIANNACGADTLCQSITVVCAPLQAGFSYSSTDLQGIFTDTTAGSMGQFWDFDDGSPLQLGSPSTHTFPGDGYYNVCLGVLNACQDTFYACDTLQFCAPITCTFNFQAGPGGLTTTFNSSVSGFASSYAWDFGDGDTSTLPNPSHLFQQAGPHTVTLVVTNLCGVQASFSSTITLVGVEQPGAGQWKIWPNPTQGIFQLDLGGMPVNGSANLRCWMPWAGNWMWPSRLAVPRCSGWIAGNCPRESTFWWWKWKGCGEFSRWNCSAETGAGRNPVLHPTCEHPFHDGDIGLRPIQSLHFRSITPTKFHVLTCFRLPLQVPAKHRQKQQPAP